MGVNCATEDWKDGRPHRCYQPGVWKHPRYAGWICDEHKQQLAEFFPDNWERKEEESEG